jgi:hypothetical protein
MRASVLASSGCTNRSPVSYGLPLRWKMRQLSGNSFIRSTVAFPFRPRDRYSLTVKPSAASLRAGSTTSRQGSLP